MGQQAYLHKSIWRPDVVLKKKFKQGNGGRKLLDGGPRPDLSGRYLLIPNPGLKLAASSAMLRNQPQQKLPDR